MERRLTALPKTHISVVPRNCQANSLNDSYVLLSSRDSHCLGYDSALNTPHFWFIPLYPSFPTAFPFYYPLRPQQCSAIAFETVEIKFLNIALSDLICMELLWSVLQCPDRQWATSNTFSPNHNELTVNMFFSYCLLLYTRDCKPFMTCV